MLLIRAAALLAIVAAGACGGGHDQKGRSRNDSSLQDARMPGDSDAHDARINGDSSAAHDSSVSTTKWKALGGTTSACKLEVAESTTSIISAQWTPCPGLADCQTAAFSEEAFLQPYFNADDGIFGIRFRNSQWMALVDLNLNVKTAWRALPASSNAYCVQGKLAVNDGYAAFSIRSQDTEGEPAKISVFHAPVSEISQALNPVVEIVRPELTKDNDIVELPFSSSAIVAQFLSPGLFWISDRNTQPVSELTAGHVVSRPRVFGSQLWWEDIGSDRVAILQANQTGSSSSIEAAAGDALGFARDGNQVAWFESNDPNITLWVAMLDGTSATEKRKVGTVSSYGPSTLGHSLLAHPIEEGRAFVVYDLKAGKRATLQLPADYAILGELLDITTSTVFAGVNRTDRPLEPVSPSLWKIDLAGLKWQPL